MDSRKSFKVLPHAVCAICINLSALVLVYVTWHEITGLMYTKYTFSYYSYCICLCSSVSVCVPLYLSVFLCIYLCSPVSVCVPLYLSVFPCICLCSSVTVCVPLYLSVCVPLYLSVFPCICLRSPVSVCIPLCLSVFPYICLSISMSVCCGGGRVDIDTVLHRWMYSPAASSHPGMSPFPVTSPAIDIISAMNEASMNLEDLINDLEPDISVLAVCQQVM